MVNNGEYPNNLNIPPSTKGYRGASHISGGQTPIANDSPKSIYLLESSRINEDKSP